MQLRTAILICVFLISCNNPDKANTVKINADSSTVGDGTIRKRTNGFNLLVSGKYSEVSIAVDKDLTVTGVYEFYNAWDNKLKEYTQICTFYFHGHYNKGDSSVAIQWGWPDEEKQLAGRLNINDQSEKLKIGIILSRTPDCYALYNFRTDWHDRKLDTIKNWIQIRIVKADKAKLYESSDSTKMKRAYLVKGNVVKVLEKSGDWYSIEYNPPNSSKSYFGWLKEGDLYKVDY
jgi:hypothetical protein